MLAPGNGSGKELNADVFMWVLIASLSFHRTFSLRLKRRESPTIFLY